MARRLHTIGDLFAEKDPTPVDTALGTAMGMATGKWTVDEIQQGRESLIHACRLMCEGYKTNWHHILVAEQLEKVATGEIPKLMVAMPPQHGKTMLCSELFPTWLLGRQKEAIMAVAYSQTRATDVATSVGRWFDSEGYRAMFPLSPIPDRSDTARGWKRMAANFNIVGYEDSKTYLGIGVGGAGTGYPRSIGIMDDVHKNYADAKSPVKQAHVHNWYSSVYGSRENALRSGSAGSIRDLLIMTRWDDNDLAGWLLKREGRVEEGGKWHEINIPAIMDEHGLKTKHPADPRELGEALWPEMRSIEKLMAQKDLLPSVFEALYQGRPHQDGGGLFKTSWFRRFTPSELPSGMWTLSCDLNFGTTGAKADTHSKASIQVWVLDVVNVKAYLVDETWDTLSFPETLDVIRSYYSKYPIVQCLIENKANGPAVIQVLSQQFNGIKPITPGRSKIARAGAIAPYAEAGKVFVAKGKMGDEFLDRLERFPATGTDDSVDAFSQMMLELGDDPLSVIAAWQAFSGQKR